MSPSDTIILQRISRGPVRIASLRTGTLLAILGGGFGLSVSEIIGVQSELDRRREHAWESRGRHFYRYAPRLTDATAEAFGTGFFDTRYFAFRKEEYHAVSF